MEGRKEVDDFRPDLEVCSELPDLEQFCYAVPMDGVYVTGEVGNYQMQLLLDTGATFTVVSSRTYKQILPEMYPELEAA